MLKCRILVCSLVSTSHIHTANWSFFGVDASLFIGKYMQPVFYLFLHLTFTYIYDHICSLYLVHLHNLGGGGGSLGVKVGTHGRKCVSNLDPFQDLTFEKKTIFSGPAKNYIWVRLCTNGQKLKADK
jgi:hypothetical protein